MSITLNNDWTKSANAWEISTDDLWNAWNILRIMLLKTTLHLFAESHNTQLGLQGYTWVDIDTDTSIRSIKMFICSSISNKKAKVLDSKIFESLFSMQESILGLSFESRGVPSYNNDKLTEKYFGTTRKRN